MIELLVVIAIIALLVSIIVPSLKMAKEQAKKVVCKSNLSQIAKAIEMYEMDYKYKRFSARNDSSSKETDLYWMGKLAPYSGNESYGEDYNEGEKIDVLLCPSAPYEKLIEDTDLQNSSGQYASAMRPWEWDRGSGLTTIGSYTINGAVAYDWYYESTSSSLYNQDLVDDAYSTWMRTPPTVPVMGCGRWTIGWPTFDGTWSWGTDGTIPQYIADGTKACTNDHMDRYCIDRHNEQINLVFKDLHVDSKAITDLWKLRWNKNWENPDFPITLASE